jgi:hypothetical protein
MLRIRILAIVGIFALSGCAGRKAAHDLTTLQLGQLIQYQSLLDKKVAAEEAFYLSARKEITENLKESAQGPLTRDFIDRHAIETTAVWKRKKRIEENDLLIFVDRVSAAYEASLSEIRKHEMHIAEEYLNSLEKVEFQRKKLQSIEEPLRKLLSELSTEQKARFLFAYIRGVQKAFEELDQESGSNAAASGGAGSP